MRSTPVRCTVCRRPHAFGFVTNFTVLPPLLAIDYVCTSRMGSRPREVHAPLSLTVPDASGGVVEYEMVGFVELHSNHCVAFVRIGPCDFVVYDDRVSYARVATGVVQITGWISLALYHRS